MLHSANELLKSGLVKGFDCRFISDLMKAANASHVDLIVAEADAKRWRRLAGRFKRDTKKSEPAPADECYPEGV
ncbi:hypothetical protein DEM27_22930 [Metarhizobium album]|uniref:Uncharacterized protein n=1 Tax=Metarhizobium album TaxID=2182425 RepID=A0A2U2DKE6_9HYPH|nr:hypothetical protein DEM27_22930 [Rhizobium album]